MRRFEQRTAELNFARRGDGPPLVLLHGIGHRWQAWEPVIDRLARRHEVVAVDLPGFGESRIPQDGRSLDLAATVEHVAEFLVHQGLERPHVAGNSLGGAVALELAASGRAASATALSPTGFQTPAERRRALLILRVLRINTFAPTPVLRLVLRSRRVTELCYGQLVNHPDQLGRDRLIGDALALRRGRGFNRMARGNREYEFCSQPSVPVTIAWGDRDRIFPPDQAVRAQSRLPNARHMLLAGCGHVPMSDDPAQVAAVILSTTGAARPG